MRHIEVFVLVGMLAAPAIAHARASITVGSIADARASIAASSIREAIVTRARGSIDGPASASDEAKAEVAKGREAAARKDFATALGHFERALQLRPAPSLFFNIAVCHHNMMLADTPGSESYEASRHAAVEAYGHYLDAAPQAKDRADVERTIAELGGRATSDEPWVIERIDPDEAPRAPDLQESSEPDASEDDSPPPPEPIAAPKPPAPDVPIGRLGAFALVTGSNLRQLARSDDMRPLPAIGLGIRGAAFLGARRRLAVGGEVTAVGQPISSRTRPVLVTGTLMPVVEYGHPLVGGRLEVGGGGGLGLAIQTLRYTGNDPPPCGLAERGPMSTRGGFLATARFVLSVLLGKKKNHEISLRVSPGIAAYGSGSRRPDKESPADMPCSEQPTPFASVGLSSPAALVVTIDLGYAPRF